VNKGKCPQPLTGGGGGFACRSKNAGNTSEWLPQRITKDAGFRKLKLLDAG